MSFQCLVCNEFSDHVVGPNTSFEICYDCCGGDLMSNDEIVAQIEKLLSDNEFIQSIFEDEANNIMEPIDNDFMNNEAMMDEGMSENDIYDLDVSDLDINELDTSEYFNMEAYDNDTNDNTS